MEIVFITHSDVAHELENPDTVIWDAFPHIMGFPKPYGGQNYCPVKVYFKVLDDGIDEDGNIPEETMRFISENLPRKISELLGLPVLDADFGMC